MINYPTTILIRAVCIGIFFTVFVSLASAQVANKKIPSSHLRSVKKHKSAKCVKNKKKTNTKPIMKNSVEKTTISTKTNPKNGDCQTKATETKEKEIKPFNEGCESPEQSDNDHKPIISEAKGSGTFNGDLRDLPNTKPVQQENPNREPPKTTPKVLKKNKVIKP